MDVQKKMVEFQRFKILKKVEIEWWDAQTIEGRFRPDDIERLSPVIGRVLGYLLKETADFYVLSNMMFDKDDYMDDECDKIIFVPKNGVISVKEVNVK